MNVLVVGDTHGDAGWFHEIIRSHAGRVDRIVQVGDFGFIFPQPARERGLDKLNKVLDRAGIDLVFLPGNHEDHPRLAVLEKECSRNADGHSLVRPRIAYAGRVSTWVWGSQRFAAVGGAVSIDRDERLRLTRKTGTAYWWPEEILSPAELHSARLLPRVDVLFTHDAPSSFPSYGLKPDLDSTAHRQAMTDVGRALSPRLWFHGHYHRSEVYGFWHRYGECEVRSLGRNKMHPVRSTALLDIS